MDGIPDALVNVDGGEVAEQEDAVVEFRGQQPIAQLVEDGQGHAQRERRVAQQQLKEKRNINNLEYECLHQ